MKQANHCRAYSESAVEQGHMTMDKVMELCILAFPSLYVSCNIVF
jgi:hypothetical protein